MLSHKKTICNSLADPTWKCHHTNLWTAKLFHLTEGLLCSFKRWRLWKEPVVDCHRWLWKEPVVMCGNWNVRQAMSQQVFRVTTFCIIHSLSYCRIVNMPSVLWHCWLGGRKGIRPVKNWVVGLSVWSEIQTCIWPSWCHCHSLSLASVKSRLVLAFWCRLIRVVLDKRPLNGCVFVTILFLLYCILL